MNNFWFYIGVGLLVWVGYDLYSGYTLLWDVIYKAQDPVQYWSVLGLWLLLALSCFFSWGDDKGAK